MSAFEVNNSESSNNSASIRSTATVLPTFGRILCCLCGVSISPNAVAMCTACMQNQPEFLAFPSTVNQDITQCPKCDRWSVALHSDHTWAAHEMESQGLLAACIKKVHSIQTHNDVKILDAQWIWTEPHSKRLKFYIDTERLIFENRLPIRQRVTCQYVIKHSQCKDCIIKNSDHTWSAQLQVRQTRGKDHTQNIEQILIRNKLGSMMNDVQMVRDGLDLFFDGKQSLEKVQTVLQRSLPCIVRSTAKKLISRDTHTGVARSEYVVVLEVVPILKHDLVLVSKPHISGKAVGIVRRVTSTIQISLLTQGGNKAGIPAHHLSVTAEKFFKHPLPVLIPAGPRFLSRFIVLDVNVLSTHFSGDDHHSQSYSLASQNTLNTLSSGRMSRAEVEVMSEDNTDIQYICETDIGHVLTPGDTVLAYDTQRLLASLQDSIYDGSSSATSNVSNGGSGSSHCHGSSGDLLLMTSDGRDVVPEVVLVSKVFEDHSGTTGRERLPDGTKAPARKHVSGGGGVKKRNRIPPWRRDKANASSSSHNNNSSGNNGIVETIIEEEEGQEEADYVHHSHSNDDYLLHTDYAEGLGNDAYYVNHEEEEDEEDGDDNYEDIDDDDEEEG